MKQNEDRMNIFEIKYGLEYIISHTSENKDTALFNELLADAKKLIDILVTSEVEGKNLKYKPSVVVDFLNALSDEVGQIKDDPDEYTCKLFRDAAEYIDEFIM